MLSLAPFSATPSSSLRSSSSTAIPRPLSAPSPSLLAPRPSYSLSCSLPRPPLHLALYHPTPLLTSRPSTSSSGISREERKRRSGSSLKKSGIPLPYPAPESSTPKDEGKDPVPGTTTRCRSSSSSSVGSRGAGEDQSWAPEEEEVLDFWKGGRDVDADADEYKGMFEFFDEVFLSPSPSPSPSASPSLLPPQGNESPAQGSFNTRVAQMKAKEQEDLEKGVAFLLSPLESMKRIWVLVCGGRMNFHLIRFPSLRHVLKLTLLTFVAVVVSAVVLSITDWGLMRLARALFYRK